MANQKPFLHRGQKADPSTQRRTAQLAYVSGLIGPFEARLREERECDQQAHLRDSVSCGLDDEVDTLAKKAPDVYRIRPSDANRRVRCTSTYPRPGAAVPVRCQATAVAGH